MDRDGCRRAWLDLAPRKHRDRHGPMGPDDSSATLMMDGDEKKSKGKMEEVRPDGLRCREMKGGNGIDVVDGVGPPPADCADGSRNTNSFWDIHTRYC